MATRELLPLTALESCCSVTTGEPMGAGMCFVRQVVHIVDSLPCYLGYLWPLWDAKRQTFADKIMTTVVVQQKKG